MKKLKLLMALGTSFGLLSLSCGSYADIFDQCAPGVNLMILETVNLNHLRFLKQFKEQLGSEVRELHRTAFDPINGPIAYNNLLNTVQQAVAQLPAANNPAIVIKAGNQVIIDTHVAAAIGDTCPDNGGNSYSCWLVNNVAPEARASVSTAQALLYPCGHGIEENWSLLAGGRRGHLSLRLGNYLRSNVTVTISENVVRADRAE